MIDVQSPLLIGTLLGLALGLSTTVPREEKLRYVFAYLFGGLAIASIGGGFYFFSETQLEFLSQFLFSFLLVFIVTFPFGLRYRRWRYRIGVGFLDWSTRVPSQSEIREIERYIPKVKAQMEMRGNFIFGFKIAVVFNVRNNTEIMLDNLDATLTLQDAELKRKKIFMCKDLSDMFPKEKANYTIEAKLGRSWYPMNVVFKVRRRRVVLEEFHWTWQEQTEG